MPDPVAEGTPVMGHSQTTIRRPTPLARARAYLRRRRVGRLRLCFLIPASPTDGFFGQIAMFRRALDHLGGPYRKATVIAVFGAEEQVSIPRAWEPYLHRVTVHAVPPSEFQKKSYGAQANARWSVAPEDCDLVIFADADVLMVRRIDDLLERLLAESSVAGAIAHYPFPQFPGDVPAQKWDSLARESIGRKIRLDYRHTLAPDSAPAAQRDCPFYVNFGFVIVPRALYSSLGARYLGLVDQVAGRLADPYFSGQVSLAMAVNALDLPCTDMDMRYNFPNDALAEQRYPESMRDVRVIHYLRTHRFDRQMIFSSSTDFRSFLAMRLTGVEAVLQAHVARLTGGHYPFTRDSVEPVQAGQ